MLDWMPWLPITMATGIASCENKLQQLRLVLSWIFTIRTQANSAQKCILMHADTTKHVADRC